MLIRGPADHELDAVGDLTVRAYTRDGHVAPDSPYVAELRDASSRAEQASLLVAVDDDAQLLGTVTFCTAATPYAETARDGESEFRMLAVAPEARGLGVARTLVHRCVEMARAAGSSALVLSTMEDMAAAQTIYRRFGFTRAPERDWEPVAGLRLLGFVLALTPVEAAPRRHESRNEPQPTQLDA